ncbi:hypothetical protein XNC3_830002 [Xenorhabdus nematophila F1]|nr:hypothetical protein XNC3_830002 [Xenorhabdus nematophila F1]CEE94387.1 hypothetical protein XNA1_4610001 [Xenorhabdus nematophila str. Anatoliense]
MLVSHNDINKFWLKSLSILFNYALHVLLPTTYIHKCEVQHCIIMLT